MSKTEDGGERLDYVVPVLLARLPQPHLRSARLRCEIERLAHGERREMDVVLGAVLDIAAVMLLNFFRREVVVPYVTEDLMIVVPLVGERLEQCRTASARAPEDHYHHSIVSTFHL